MYLTALKIAHHAHKGQTRKDSNVPYIVHPIRVSGYFNDDFRKTIAVLHDVVEDTEISLEDLKEEFPQYYSINEKLIYIIDLLTRKPEENYFDYIKKIKENEVATKIKVADIVDNLSDTISVISESMLERYTKSLDILLS